tara:strand:+ start:1109 stop:1306 length:198 start_codon:yes stop_codon:yes gene_type:complete
MIAHDPRAARRTHPMPPPVYYVPNPADRAGDLAPSWAAARVLGWMIAALIFGGIVLLPDLLRWLS